MVDGDLDNIQIKHLLNRSVDHYHVIKLLDDRNTAMASSKGKETQKGISSPEYCSMVCTSSSNFRKLGILGNQLQLNVT
jgi:hypothetical protein